MEAYKLKTPYFLIEKEELEQNIATIDQALNQYWENSIVGYSVKTNPVRWLLDYFRKNKFYAEVMSDEEYALAVATGFKGEHILYNGPAKSKENFLQAIESGSLVSIDSQRELDWLEDLDPNQEEIYQVGLRVHVDVETHCSHFADIAAEGGRFGFSYETGELKRAINTIETLSHVELADLYFSSPIKSLEAYQTLARIAGEIKKNYHLTLRSIYLGALFEGLAANESYSASFQSIADELGKVFDPEETTLIVEAGPSLIASPVQFVTQVFDVKETTRNRFVLVDGSRINIDPQFKASNYLYSLDLEENRERRTVENQVISGVTSLDGDCLLQLENHPELLPGDNITFHQVGAYTMSLSPLFMKGFSDIYVKENNDYYKVREKWGLNKYLETQTEKTFTKIFGPSF